MGIALGGANLGVAEQPPDHFQRGPAGDQKRGEGVAEVVDADVGDFGTASGQLRFVAQAVQETCNSEFDLADPAKLFN